MNPRRRVILAILGATGWAALSHNAGAAGTRRTVSLPSLTDPRRPDFAAFYRLCKVITNFPTLDAGFCGRLYRLVRKEPWGLEHVAQTYARARELGSSNGKILDPSQYSDGQRWFVGHLLVTLYTGIYYHDSGHRAIGFEHALMHRAVGRIRATPTRCGGEFGFWSLPPATN